jgi:Predicted transporter component
MARLAQIAQGTASIIFAGLFGVVFGTGLVLSHMIDPARVAGFLDVAGDWNPALAFVMGGAVVTAAPAFWLARRRQKALLGTPLTLPDRFHVNGKLVFGAALFGLGWGLSGICPGPGLVLLASLSPPAIVFVGALAVGVFLADATRLPRHGQKRDAP